MEAYFTSHSCFSCVDNLKVLHNGLCMYSL
eukprot:COSAG02_NODE_26061_length_642_cov_0.825046_1_plen_29_part_10